MSKIEQITRTKLKNGIEIKMQIPWKNGLNYLALVTLSGFAITDLGNNKKEYTDSFTLGSPREAEYTLRECYQLLLSANNFNNLIANKIKDIVLNALNEDLGV